MSVENDNYIASYTYNGDGLRAGKTVTKDDDTTVTRFVYESGQIVMEHSGGSESAHNVYDGSQLISRTTSQSTLYYVYNGHGDVVQLTSSNGTVMMTYDYDAFGNLKVAYTDDTNPYRYCGEYFDIETGTYYLRARYYSPRTGRFTQQDTCLGSYSDPLSLNLYTYCYNNPLIYHDPSGNVVTEWDMQNCSAAQIAQIQAATNDWNAAKAAGDTAGMAAAHAQANAARAGNLNSGQYIGSQGYVYNANGTYAQGGNVNVYLGQQYAEQGPVEDAPVVDTGKSKPVAEIEETANNVTNPSVDININGSVIGNATMRDNSVWGNAWDIARALGLQYDSAIGMFSVGGKKIRADWIGGVYSISVRQIVEAAGYGDCLSWWSDSDGMHVYVNRDLKTAPIKVIRTGNHFDITAYIEYDGIYDSKIPKTNTPYAQAFEEGIEYYWSTPQIGASTKYDFDGAAITVSTSVIVKGTAEALGAASGQRYHRVDVANAIGRGKTSNCLEGWSVSGTQTVTMPISYYSDYEDFTDPHPRNEEEFRRLAAHEFGHLFGIGDAYAEGNRAEAYRTNEVPDEDVMRSYLIEGMRVTANDIEMMWEAFYTNSYQYFRSYDEYTMSRVVRKQSSNYPTW